MRGQLTLAIFGLLVSAPAALAACDLPTLGPTDLPIGAQGDAPGLHIVTGIIGICDPATRSFRVELPDLHGIQIDAVQLALAGFSRRYGVHQIGFVIQSAKATASGTGVIVQYGAVVDGLDRYQLAYTLDLNASH